MQIRVLKLLNFRNYSNLQLNFNSKLNIIYGKNGSGKTNIVEAIYVLGLTKSFRGSKDDVLINYNSDITRIEGELVTNNIISNYKLIISKDGKKAKINNTKQNKLSNYISNIYIIMFNPDNLKIIKDSPSVRRKNLDIDLLNYNKEYLVLLNNYKKILKQRNAYLKTTYLDGYSDSNYLNILTEKLIDYGLNIYKIRNEYFNDINKIIGIVYKTITNKDSLTIKYNSSFAGITKNNLILKYKKNIKQDYISKRTSLGIHNDDYFFSLNNRDLKDFGSEGQQKNAIISYKLSQIKLIEDKKNQTPILILDDLFSELDSEKINNIISLLDDNIQTFITTTEISNINSKLLKKGNKYLVENEKVEVQ